MYFISITHKSNINCANTALYQAPNFSKPQSYQKTLIFSISNLDFDMIASELFLYFHLSVKYCSHFPIIAVHAYFEIVCMRSKYSYSLEQ